MKNGNLYWELQFTALTNGAAALSDNEMVNFSVKSHDFSELYRIADVLHTAATRLHPAAIYSVNLYLRDDGTGIPDAKYFIYTAYHILPENVDAFFSVGADRCMRFALLH